MRPKTREDFTRFTMPLDKAENALLLALQSHLVAKYGGKPLPRAEVMRECLRRCAALEGVSVSAQ